MKILIPNNNINERKYVIEILLREFLGLVFSIEIKPIENYQIILDNGKKLFIDDCFFNNFVKDLEYLNKDNIPEKVEFYKNSFIVEKDIPAIYGNKKFVVNENKIFCGIDVFASSFFMLTRWEETVNKTRDKHMRFPAQASLAYKNSFLHRPVVNEYIEMIWNMLNYLGYKGKRKEKKFELIITHDIDELYFWKSKKQFFRIVAGDLLKRKNLTLVKNRILEFYLVSVKKIKDPYNTFEWLMDKSEEIGLKSRFYFMSGGITKYDNRYKIEEAKNVIEIIRKRGHIVGFHPSYNAYNNNDQFRLEKKVLEKVYQSNIFEGREHYLRFEVPATWQIWKDNNMKVDSSCGYADKTGFRCGTGDEFSVFNILTRKKLNLKERPLIVMEGTYTPLYSDMNEKTIYADIMLLKNLSEKYQMKFTILFHNNIFVKIKTFKKIYQDILKP